MIAREIWKKTPQSALHLLMFLHCWVLGQSNTWWRHQMEHFPRNWPFVRWIIGRFTSQRPLTRSYDVFFDVRPDVQLEKQCSCLWFKTPWSWCPCDHCNGPLHVQHRHLKGNLYFLQLSITKRHKDCFPTSSCRKKLVDWLQRNAYRQTTNIKGTKQQNVNVCHLVLQSSLPNPSKPGVKSRMKM